jgi:hypothetical protein
LVLAASMQNSLESESCRVVANRLKVAEVLVREQARQLRNRSKSSAKRLLSAIIQTAKRDLWQSIVADEERSSWGLERRRLSGYHGCESGHDELCLL